VKSKLYTIDGPWRGQLAILPRPRGGDWLEDEIAAWKKSGLEVVVSALTPQETETMELDQEQSVARRQGLEALSFPIADRGTPKSVSASKRFFRQLGGLLADGKHVGIHCRQGIGRSSLLAASLLILAGIGSEEAWRRIEAARGCQVPDTAEQKIWVEQFTRSVLAGEPV
jgi:protein-tyrosine phosphatase